MAGKLKRNLMITDRKIVGICQVRNEDVFLNQALANIEDFCDEILVADHCSTDRTAEIANVRAKANPKIIYHRIKHPSEAHEMIRKYSNTATWVFPVDGDELYDPSALTRLRREIMLGSYEAYRQIYGHSFHCVEIDKKRKIAKGYTSPPSRTVTKLYNFGALIDWAGPCSEKCLGGKIIFKDEFSEQSNLNLMEKMTWSESPLRLLHACFMARSSLELLDNWKGRKNPYEIYSMSRLERWIALFRKIIKLSECSEYKMEKYMRGALVEEDISNFFSAQ
ncbi:MAG: glycosyltransferase [Candidatus Electrothrix sp. LOE2]|nr:glycosyltransferase [Candidatus Electrothrix sp. LOE2]